MSINFTPPPAPRPNRPQLKVKCSLESSVDSVNTCESERDMPVSTAGKKIKVELCKNYMERGHCPYGGRCKFAHGVSELRQNECLS